MSSQPVIDFYTAPYYALDNWSAHAVSMDGVVYPTAEHAYHCGKFAQDSEAHRYTRQAISPYLAKGVSREFLHLVTKNWEQSKVLHMTNVLVAKLSQHRDVREILQSTAGSMLVEGSPTDPFWGTGPDGLGLNMLGKLWTKLRDGE
jgi:N-glycosidase YbiA